MLLRMRLLLRLGPNVITDGTFITLGSNYYTCAFYMVRWIEKTRTHTHTQKNKKERKKEVKNGRKMGRGRAAEPIISANFSHALHFRVSFPPLSLSLEQAI